MKWAVILTLALAPAFFLASLFVYADSCSNAIKPAIGCPSGYKMTCLTEGYERYECTKMVDGIVIPIGAELPQEQHDTIEKSVMNLSKASHRTESPLGSTTTPKKIYSKKPVKTASTTASPGSDVRQNDWRSWLPAWLRWRFDGSSTTVPAADEKVGTTSPDKILSNGYFTNFFKRIFRW